MTSRPNVLVLVLDSVRARNTSLHGYAHRTTPNLERLAAEATVYRFAYAPSTTSLSSHVSMFTGVHEDAHRLYGTERTLRPGTTIWERLRDEHDYRTGVFTVNPQFGKPVGLTNGFQTTVLDRPRETKLPFPAATNPADFDVDGPGIVPDHVARVLASLRQPAPIRTLYNGLARYRDDRHGRSADIVDAFFEWESRPGPWAAFVNLMDAHAPYLPGPAHDRWADEDLREVQAAIGGGHFVRSREVIADGSWWKPRALRHLYDGAIHQVDAMVGRIFDRLADRGRLDDTLVIVTADHGEGFGEHSRLHPGHHVFAHTPGVHEVQTHVPLLVRAPDGPRGESVSDPASLTHLPTAIAGAIPNGFEPDAFCGPDGRVLVSRGTGGDTRYRIDDDFAAGERVALPERSYACYERETEGVLKYCRSGDRSATVLVHSAQASARIADQDDGKCDAHFPGPRSGDIVRSNGDGELDRHTRDRLEAFGYL